MRVVERVGNVARDHQRALQWKLLFSFDQGAKRITLDEGHRVVEEIARLPGIEHGDDVWMVELNGDVNFAAEALGAHTRRQIRCEHLHDDLSSEMLVVGDEDASHAAAAELASDVKVRA